MYHIVVPTAATVGKESLSASVEELLKTLRRHGYETDF